MPYLVLKAQQTGSGSHAYMRGHCVAVLPDGHVFGAREGLPRFLILQVPQAFVDANPNVTAEDTNRRRGLRLDVDALPPGILVALEASGNANVGLGVVNAILKAEDRTPQAQGQAVIPNPGRRANS
jgi:hypothetical protein